MVKPTLREQLEQITAMHAEAFRLAIFHQERADKAEASLAAISTELIETRQQRDKAEYDRTYAIGGIKTLLRELGEDGSPPSGGADGGAGVSGSANEGEANGG